MQSLGISNMEFKTLSDYFGRLAYIKITVDYCDYNPNTYSFYVNTLEKPCVFYYILLMDIYPQFRYNGFGRRLFMRFYNVEAPDIVLLDCGIVDSDVYMSIDKDKIPQWLEDNVKPFWEKMGFHDINYLNTKSNETITMIYPFKEALRLDSCYKNN